MIAPEADIRPRWRVPRAVGSTINPLAIK